LPRANWTGVGHNVPKEVRVRTQFVTAETVREVLDASFGSGSLLWLADAQPLVESRLQETTGESKRNERMEWR
jgi:hypothetical protein